MTAESSRQITGNSRLVVTTGQQQETAQIHVI